MQKSYLYRYISAEEARQSCQSITAIVFTRAVACQVPQDLENNNGAEVETDIGATSTYALQLKVDPREPCDIVIDVSSLPRLNEDGILLQIPL